MLAVLVALMLVPTWTDGLLLTRCELKSQLEEAFSQLSIDYSDELIAQLACTIENSTSFSTPLISPDDGFLDGSGAFPTAFDNTGIMGDNFFPEYTDPALASGDGARMMWDAPSGDGNSLISGDSSGEGSGDQSNGARKKRDVPSQGDNPLMSGDSSGVGSGDQSGLFEPPPVYDYYEMPSGNPEAGSGSGSGSGSGTGSGSGSGSGTGSGSGSGSGSGPQKRRRKRSSADQTTYYGIFQLSAAECNSGSSDSSNTCGLDCSALTDDNITDNLKCLMTLMDKGEWAFPPDCQSVNPSDYFAECG